MENRLRPNKQRANNAILFIWITLGMQVCSLLSGYLQYDMLQMMANGVPISKESVTFNDYREAFVTCCFLLVSLISGITFIQWFRRAYYNLHQINRLLTYSEGWAAGCWFVPIMNFYAPCEIMIELHKEIKKLLTARGYAVDFTLNAVYSWWALWIIARIAGNIMHYFMRDSDTVNGLITFTIIGMVIDLLGIPLALLTVKIIKGYSKYEDLLIEVKEDKAE